MKIFPFRHRSIRRAGTRPSRTSLASLLLRRFPSVRRLLSSSFGSGYGPDADTRASAVSYASARSITNSPALFTQYSAFRDSNVPSPLPLAVPRDVSPARSSDASDEILSWLEKTPQPTRLPSPLQPNNAHLPAKHSQLPAITTSSLTSSSSKALPNPPPFRPTLPSRASRSYLDLSDGDLSPISSHHVYDDSSKSKSHLKSKKTGLNSLFGRRQVASPTSPLHAKFMTTRREIVSIVPVKIIHSPRRTTPSNTPIPLHPAARPSQYSTSSPGGGGFPYPKSAASSAPAAFSLGRAHDIPTPSSFPSNPPHPNRLNFQSHQSYASNGSSISSQKISSKACRILGLEAPPLSPQHSLFAPDPPKPRFISHAASSSATSSARSGGSISSPLASTSSRPSIDTPYGSPKVSFAGPQQPDGSYVGIGAGGGKHAVEGSTGGGSTLKRGGSIVPSKAKQVLGMLPPKAEKLLGIEEDDSSSEGGHHRMPSGMVWQLPPPTAGGAITPEPSPIPLLPPRLPNPDRDSGLFSLYSTLDAFSLSTTSLPQAPLAIIPRSPKSLLPSLHQHSQSVPWTPPNPLSQVRQRKKSALSSTSSIPIASVPREESSIFPPASSLRRRPTLPTVNLPPSLRESCLLPDDEFTHNRSPPPAMPTASIAAIKRERNSKRLTLVSSVPSSSASTGRQAGSPARRPRQSLFVALREAQRSLPIFSSESGSRLSSNRSSGGRGRSKGRI
jgi:hypothetical protein